MALPGGIDFLLFVTEKGTQLFLLRFCCLLFILAGLSPLESAWQQYTSKAFGCKASVASL